MTLLTLRVFNSISISFLIINTTPFNDIIKGLKMFRIPDSLLMIITLAYLYIFILSNLVAESYLAMKSGRNIQSGIFGADMKVSLVNDGPVTIIMDSKNKE
jgi:energy-coupling factor transporter transmembrane protein EcfT